LTGDLSTDHPAGRRHNRRAIYFGGRLTRQIDGLFVEAVNYLIANMPPDRSLLPVHSPCARCASTAGPGSFGQLFGRSGRRYVANISGSMLTGLKRASRLRFWAVAASRNSSLAPFGPLRRKRVTRRIRLRWANNISTFFRRRQASTYSGVAACARATSRASSCRSRGILRARALGQDWALSLQVSQSNLLAR
jgi:hypothetical protein